MNLTFQQIVCSATGADELFHIEDIQSLWSGYGKVMRYGLKGCARDTVVVKHVRLPECSNHPRGWNTDISHQRKIKSYYVEIAWYRDWAHACGDHCRIPQCLAAEAGNDEFLMVFEDLDASGFSGRRESASMAEME